ncbi:MULTISPECIES: hypothetical protein [unclassified Streptomyces]|uniref:hypothetical protein n=1 Tax=unclassified Streptomyces TaxID=2593676 RepID=UPI001B380902|nr:MULTISPECIES: hypothetical protein [unclassified Streptomyces]MBQ0866925.1 hypothetical protein [Streptomyces sp. RK75]MBQ1124648.1 hypothetical protein [Streptomyces sp. B15]
MSQPPQQQSPPGVTSGMVPEPDHGAESYRGSGRLTGKTALITDGTAGSDLPLLIGCALAEDVAPTHRTLTTTARHLVRGLVRAANPSVRRFDHTEHAFSYGQRHPEPVIATAVQVPGIAAAVTP